MGVESKSGGSIWKGFEEWKIQRDEEQRQVRRRSLKPHRTGRKNFSQKAGDLIARATVAQSQQQVSEIPPNLRL